MSTVSVPTTCTCTVFVLALSKTRLRSPILLSTFETLFDIIRFDYGGGLGRSVKIITLGLVIVLALTLLLKCIVL